MSFKLILIENISYDSDYMKSIEVGLENNFTYCHSVRLIKL